MEAVVSVQQDGSVSDSLTDGESSQINSDSSPSPAPLAQSGVTVFQLPGGQTVQVQGVIQAQTASVIQSPQQTGVEGDGDSAVDSQKRLEILSRRPSYRKILNELSSDSRSVPKIEEEKDEHVVASSSVATVTVPTSIYQTSSGQYFTISQGGALQLASGGAEALGGLQTLTLPSAGGPQAGATILQYAPQTTETSQFLLSGGQVLVQAATGDMPTYQIRSPASGLPQAVVMAASPGAMHSPPPHAEEVTRKREVRLMKNREAARECRRKKKEYVKCLENRVAVLENQNKTLIEELKALKDIYCHKAE
ncbi:cAMP-responsive element modulator isoform X1 [Alosa sapidissima]|uniref:cAMP-responsive element modulator isoform X1 n=1 Tax=Alosa sapidissima TaxID=34773 RepID=UPI001C08FFF8|nr:cAMP-responsive element modulator isoform X1 [Alosa sapidissima]XP_041927503.1 cAMP-responsive element modulator isoform X1 [Alosa sapidissima]